MPDTIPTWLLLLFANRARRWRLSSWQYAAVLSTFATTHSLDPALLRAAHYRHLLRNSTPGSKAPIPRAFAGRTHAPLARARVLSAPGLGPILPRLKPLCPSLRGVS